MLFPKMSHAPRRRATARGSTSAPGQQPETMPPLQQHPVENAGGGVPAPDGDNPGNAGENAGLANRVATMSDEEMRQVLDIRKQQEKEKRVMLLDDLKNRVNNITVQTIWRHCKYPDLNSSDGDEFQKVLVQQMPDKTAEEIKKEWKLFKTVINLCLRGRRSYVSQMMKLNYFGEFLFFLMLLLVMVHSDCFF